MYKIEKIQHQKMLVNLARVNFLGLVLERVRIGRAVFRDFLVVIVGIFVLGIDFLSAIGQIAQNVLGNLVIRQRRLVGRQEVGQGRGVVGQAVDATSLEMRLDVLGHVIPEKKLRLNMAMLHFFDFLATLKKSKKAIDHRAN